MSFETASVFNYRRPWYWLAVVLLLAIGVSGIVARSASLKIGAQERQFDSLQALRLQRTEQRIDDFFAEAQLMTGIGTRTSAVVLGNGALTEKLIAALYRSHENSGVYGLGAFYAPYRFSPKRRFFNVYDHTGGAFLPFESGIMHPLSGGVTEIVATNNQGGKANDYTLQGWFLRAVAAQGAVAFFGPYVEDGRSFISTVQAFYSHRHLAGVFSVDTLTPQFLALMRASLAPGDIAWIEGSDSRGRALLSTASLAHASQPRIDHRLPLRYTGAFLHISTDATALQAARQRIIAESVAIGVGIWLLAGLLAMGLVQRWRALDEARRSELRELKLQQQIAIATSVETELRKAANTDALTGLPNRRYLLDRLSGLIDGRISQQYGLFFVDLDRFNVTNDTLGHAVGDELLKAIGARLGDALPPRAEIARLGGDEFVVVAPAADTDEAASVAMQLLDALHEPFSVDRRAIYATGSAGVVVIDEHYGQPEDVLRDADIAMYEAKQRGRARYAIFGPIMRERVAKESQLGHDLRHAVEYDEFIAYYQPIIDLSAMRLASVEVLARWNRPGHGLVGAPHFIPYAEMHGLVDAIDDAMLAQACANIGTLSARFPGVTASVNLSAAHLTRADLYDTITSALRSGHIPPATIKLEITETAMMSDSLEVMRTLTRVHEDGLQIVIDDFGVGHSSLAYLQRLPIAGIKIDRTFIDPLPRDTQTVAIVRSIVALAHTLGLYTVAEGVETAEQARLIGSLGVMYAQGFYFARPMSLEDLLEFSLDVTNAP